MNSATRMVRTRRPLNSTRARTQPAQLASSRVGPLASSQGRTGPLEARALGRVQRRASAAEFPDGTEAMLEELCADNPLFSEPLEGGNLTAGLVLWYFEYVAEQDLPPSCRRGLEASLEQAIGECRQMSDAEFRDTYGHPRQLACEDYRPAGIQEYARELERATEAAVRETDWCTPRTAPPPAAAG